MLEENPGLGWIQTFNMTIHELLYLIVGHITFAIEIVDLNLD
jgi:hypothetical protein